MLVNWLENKLILIVLGIY